MSPVGQLAFFVPIDFGLGIKRLERHDVRVSQDAKVVHDFSRQNRRKKNARTLRRKSPTASFNALSACRAAPTKVVDYSRRSTLANCFGLRASIISLTSWTTASDWKSAKILHPSTSHRRVLGASFAFAGEGVRLCKTNVKRQYIYFAEDVRSFLH